MKANAATAIQQGLQKMFGCLRLEPVDFQTALDGFVSSALYQGVVIPELRPSTISTDGPLSRLNVEPSSGVPSSGNEFGNAFFGPGNTFLTFSAVTRKNFISLHPGGSL